MRRSGVQIGSFFLSKERRFRVSRKKGGSIKLQKMLVPKKVISGALNTMDLMKIYNKLYAKFGPQHWWPGDSREEIIIGAILTQSANWKNVEKAIVNLKKNKSINFSKILKTNNARLSEIIKPAGYHNQKAKKLKAVSEFFLKLGSRIPNRAELLEVHGIGPETADSIRLYAYAQPEFVVDTYTKRIFSKLKLIKYDMKYHDIKNFFETNLPKDAKLFNEYHALIVQAGKELKTNKAFLSEF